jgi:hypothetical protein
MSDLLEALKDTNHLIEAILKTNPPGHGHSETLKETRTRAQLLTDRIIEASRQAGAVQAKEPEPCTSITRADELERSIREALNVLGWYSTTSITNAIRILKAAINGATP